ESDELVLLGCAETVEIVGHGLRFAAMLLNRAKEGHAPAVVEQFGARSNAPEGRCAHFVRGLLAAGLHDTVASPHVVEKEVAVRVKDRVAQRRRDMDRASSDGC